MTRTVQFLQCGGLAIALALGGCGFRLAHTSFSTLLSEGVEITASNSDRSFQNALHRALDRAGVARTGKWQLEVLSVQKGSKALVSSRSDFDVERLVQLKVNFRIRDPEQKLFRHSISAGRRLVQNFSRLNISTELDEFYQTEMERELANRVVRYLALVAGEKNRAELFGAEEDATTQPEE